MDRLSTLEIFSRVVEKEGFSAAARDLGLSKSAISKAVARLEDRLGVRLLNRTTRRLSVTPAGRLFLDHALRALAAAEEAERAVAGLHAEPRGLLRVNAPMTFGTLHLSDAVPEFLARYPQVSLELILNDRFVDLVEEGFDVAIRITSKLADSGLFARKLAPSRRLMCGTPAYFEKHGLPRHPDDLKAHNCLTYSYFTMGDDWRYVGPDGPGSVPLRGNFRANNGEILRGALLAGIGIAPMPTFIVGDDLRQGRLQAVLTDYHEPAGGLYAVYPSNRHLSAKVRVFIDFLADRFGPVPYWD